MSGCDREQGTHYQCDCMRERSENLERALKEAHEEIERLRACTSTPKRRSGDRPERGRVMGPYDPAEVELFDALDYCDEMDEKYGEGNMDAIRPETEWMAW